MSNRNQISAKSLGYPTLLAQREGGAFSAYLSSNFQRIRDLVGKVLKQRSRRRKLQLLEMQQLGDKRFVAIVRVGKQKFLIGGATGSVSLLAEIGAPRATALASRPLSEEGA